MTSGFMFIVNSKILQTDDGNKKGSKNFVTLLPFFALKPLEILEVTK
jgi:hypothetical protein